MKTTTDLVSLLWPYAPYGVGSPPALVLAINLYNGIMTTLDEKYWLAAGAVSVIGIIFTIMVEAKTYQALARAFAEKEIKAAIAAGAGALLVSGMIIYGVYSGQNTKALISSTIFSAVCYGVIMIITYLDTTKTVKIEMVDEQLRIESIQAENAAKLAAARTAEKNQERLIALAEVRRAKVLASAGGQSLSGGNQVLSTGQNGQAQPYKFDPAKLSAVVGFLKSKPNPADVTVREIAEAGLGLGKSAAALYKNEAMKQVTK